MTEKEFIKIYSDSSSSNVTTIKPFLNFMNLSVALLQERESFIDFNLDATVFFLSLSKKFLPRKILKILLNPGTVH